MKIFLVSRPFVFACLGVVFAASAVPAAPPSFSFFMAELENMPSLHQKLQYLQTYPPADDQEKVAVAVAMIQAAPPESRGETAARVVELLARLNPRPENSARFAAAVAAGLPEKIAPSVASSIILGAGRADPSQLPRITVAVLTSQRGTMRNAAPIVEEVVAAAPVAQGSSIAAAIGGLFASDKQFAQSAPEIAAAITRGLLSKLPGQASYAQVQQEISESIAGLVVGLPGSWQSINALVVKVGQAVARVIGPTQPAMAASIVGSTSAALRSAAGSSDISFVINDFRNAFGNVSEQAAQQAAQQATAQAPMGALEPVGALEALEALPNQTSYVLADLAAVAPRATPAVAVGSVASPESNVVNQ